MALAQIQSTAAPNKSHHFSVKVKGNNTISLLATPGLKAKM